MLGISPDMPLRPERQADALEQAEQVVGAAEPHVRQHLRGGEIVDPDHQVLAQAPEIRRQPGIGLAPPGPRNRPATGREAGAVAAGRSGGCRAWRGHLGGRPASTKQLTAKPKCATLTIIKDPAASVVSVMSRIRSLFGLLALIGALVSRLFGPRLGGVLRLQRSPRPGSLQLQRHAGRYIRRQHRYSAPRYSRIYSRDLFRAQRHRRHATYYGDTRYWNGR